MRALVTRLLLFVMVVAVMTLAMQPPRFINASEQRVSAIVALYGSDALCHESGDGLPDAGHRCPLCHIHALPEAAGPAAGPGMILVAMPWLRPEGTTPLPLGGTNPANPSRAPPPVLIA